HTRSYGDWSSDVCSSDLEKLTTRRGCAGSAGNRAARLLGFGARQRQAALAFLGGLEALRGVLTGLGEADLERVAVEVGDALERRSEERRVGKECRSVCAR